MIIKNKYKLEKNWFSCMRNGAIKAISSLPAIMIFIFLAVAINVDAQTVTYYFNSSNAGNWDGDSGSSPMANVVDGNQATFGSDNNITGYVYTNGNTCPGTNLGTITKVELRVHHYNNYGIPSNALLKTLVPRLVPYFGGSSPGGGHNDPAGDYRLPSAWGSYFNITSDVNAPGTWSWSDVQDLDCRIEIDRPDGKGRLWVSKVEIRVTYASPPPCNAPTSVSATSSESTICSGDPVTFEYSTQSGGNCSGLWHYQWRDATGGGGDYVRNWNVTADYTPGTNLTETTTYYLYMRCGDCTGDVQEASSGVTVTVYSAPTSVSATSSESTICSGDPVTFQYDTHSGGNLSGNWEYQWRDATGGGGSIVRAWNTTANYTPSTNLTATTTYYLYMRCSDCTGDVQEASSGVTVTVNSAPTSVSAISSASTICSGDPVTFQYNGHSGGSCSGNWEYQWRDATGEGGTIVRDWNTTASYTPSTNLTATTTYYLYMRCSDCTGDVQEASSGVTVTVSAPTSVSATSSASTICSGDAVTFEYSTHTGGSCSGNWEYQWRDATGGGGEIVRNWSTTADYTPSPNLTAITTTTYYLYMRCSDCTSDVQEASSGVAVTVSVCGVLDILILTDDIEIKSSSGILYVKGGIKGETNGSITNAGTIYLSEYSVPGRENWTNNSSDNFLECSGTVVFNSSKSQTIQGTNSTTFNNLTINNTIATPDDGVSLSVTINVDGTLTMSDGCFNMNSYNIALGTTGTVLGETNNTRIYGGTGKITASRTLNAPSSENVAGLGAVITSAANLGNTNIERGHTAQTGIGNTSIERYYDITPTNNTGLNATLRFYYFDAELNSQTSNSDMKLWKSADSGSTWTNEGGSWTDNTTNDYVELNGMNGFSRWTVSSKISSPLPIELRHFTATCKDGIAELTWSTASEINNDYFTLEKSADGINFEILSITDGIGNSNIVSNYSFYDIKPDENTYYRLKQTDFNGSFKYSDIIASSCFIASACEKDFVDLINIYPNPAQNYFNFSVYSSIETDICANVISSSGQLIITKQFHISSGMNKLNLNLSSMSKGIYLLKVITTSGLNEDSMRFLKD